MALYNMEWVTNEYIKLEIPQEHPGGHQRLKKTLKRLLKVWYPASL